MLSDKNILLVIAGGIAAYKSLDLIRRLRDRGAGVRCVLTDSGAQFVTPLSVSALASEEVYRDLFSLTDESKMGHIRLSREADLIVVAPATANLMAKMAAGLADDLASTVLLATNKPVLLAPAMNVHMWEHPATRRNLAQLHGDGIASVGPEIGELADGEYGAGRMAEPATIVTAIEAHFAGFPADAAAPPRPLRGVRALVTSGPTHEALDPVRYLSNRSSGKQGHAIAAALAAAGAETILVAGPTALADPADVTTVHAESAREMEAACLEALPVDVAVCAAAVADWRPADTAPGKIKKDGAPPPIDLVENPDILAGLAADTEQRPALVVGFAAETGNVLEHARRKLERKRCDWILANDVSAASGVIGGDSNTVHLITADDTDSWPALSKAEVAARLVARIADHFGALEKTAAPVRSDA